ncbi:MAG: hypothetical protein R2712_28380 [Vicinamibacterales bacterium]
MGLEADVFAGHSNGEHAALMAAGVMRFPDMAALCAFVCGVALEAEHLPAPAVSEAVAAITGLGATAVEALLDPAAPVLVAVDNCPTQCLIAGHAVAVDDAVRSVAGKGRGAHPPAVRAGAPHAPVRRLVAPARVALRRRGHRAYHAAFTRYSCLTAARYGTNPAEVRACLAEQWSGRVRFREMVEAMYADGVRTFSSRPDPTAG